MKEKLVSVFGGFGIALWYLFSILYAFAPLYILHFPFWLDFILICVITTVPLFGEIVRLALYIWAFVVALNQPLDVFTIVFFACAALYFFTTLVPMAVSLFSKK